MALWLDSGSEPQTESEKADLDAIAALKESTAIELKAFCWATKSSLALDLLREAKLYCERGLEVAPDNEDLKKMAKLASAKLAEREEAAEVSKALTTGVYFCI